MLSSRDFAADSALALSAQNNLALAYYQAGKLQQAIELYRRVRDIRMKVLGPEHADTLVTQNNLAMAYQAAGRVSQAIVMLEQVRNVVIKNLGDKHPLSLTAQNNVAVAYLADGKLTQAIELLERVRSRARVAIIGPDHPDTLATFSNLAMAYQSVGNLQKALPLFEQAASGMEKRNFQLENAAQILSHTIAAYEAAEQFGKAENWRRKWMAVVKQKAGVGSPAYAGEPALLSLNLLRQKKYADAEPMLRNCLELRKKLLDRKQAAPWQVAYVKSMLGESLLGQKKPVEAEPLLVAGYDGLKQDEKAIPEMARNDRMAEAIRRLLDLATVTNRPDDVKKWQAELDRYPAQKPVEKK